MTEEGIQKKNAIATDVFTNLTVQSRARILFGRIQAAANYASVNSIILVAKLEADKKHGNANPQQVDDEMLKVLEVVNSFIGESLEMLVAMKKAGEL